MPPRKEVRKRDKPKGRKRTKMERVRQSFRDLHREHGIERLLQWYDEDCKSPPKRGRVPTPRSWLMPFSEPVRMTNSTGKAKTPFRFVQQGFRKKRRKAHKI